MVLLVPSMLQINPLSPQRISQTFFLVKKSTLRVGKGTAITRERKRFKKVRARTLGAGGGEGGPLGPHLFSGKVRTPKAGPKVKKPYSPVARVRSEPDYERLKEGTEKMLQRTNDVLEHLGAEIKRMAGRVVDADYDSLNTGGIDYVQQYTLSPFYSEDYLKQLEAEESTSSSSSDDDEDLSLCDEEKIQ